MSAKFFFKKSKRMTRIWFAIPFTVILLLFISSQTFSDTTIDRIIVTPADQAIWISAYYSNDTDANNTLSISWKLSTDAIWPTSPQYTTSHLSSPYTYKITELNSAKLANGTSYDVRVLFNDSPVTGVNPSDFIGIVPSTIMHNSENATLKDGTIKWSGDGFTGWGVPGGKYEQFECATCHERSAKNIKRVKGAVSAPSAPGYTFPGGTVNFQSMTQFGDDSDSHTISTKVCEICHSKTNYHRYNTGDQSDLGHYNTETCTDKCHMHKRGFGHGTKGGKVEECIECHGHDPGYVYDAAKPASQGKGSIQAHSTHTENDADDLKGPNVGCDTCHDTSYMPFFNPSAGGTDSDGDGRYNLAETNVCNTCHSPNGDYDGVNDPVIGAKANWKTGVYSGNDLASGKEKWCAGCHDKEPSKIQNVDAPNVIGDESGAFTYGTGWGFYKTGHGLPSGSTYPASGGVTAGANKGCDACHDLSTRHIDGVARTFDDGGSNTLDPSYYRAGYRLKQVEYNTGTGSSKKEPMLVPWPSTTGNSANNYRLCITCHGDSPFLYQDYSSTNFVDTTYSPSNLHYYHLGRDVRYPADWSGTGYEEMNSKMTCVACHNVHGSTRLAMVRDGKLIGREPGIRVWYYNSGIFTYDNMSTNDPSTTNLPLAASTGAIFVGESANKLCYANCHGAGTTIEESRLPFNDNLQQGPVLSWTGETNFATDGANPDAGAAGSFEFRVKYTDANNDPPSGDIQVWVDKDSNDIYNDVDEKISLTEVDGGDITYYDGKIYSAGVTLDTTGGNIKKYRFYTVGATGTPTVADSSVYVLGSSSGSGNAPVLDWTGEPNYTADGVNPDTAPGGSSFEFRVKYSDAENNPPELIQLGSKLIQLWIDENHDGVYSASEKHIMTEYGGGADYVAGRYFKYDMSLPKGSYQYRFYATDGQKDAYLNTGPVSNNTLVVTNNVPTLTWTSQPGFDNGVDPDTGEGGTLFTFQVDYADPDNDAPYPIQVWIDIDDSGDYVEGEKIDLALVDGHYSTTMRIPYAGDGRIIYRFYASDGTDAATGDPTSDRSLKISPPTGNARPSLSWTSQTCLTNGVRPGRGAAGADFEFMVVYQDNDIGQCPTAIRLLIDENDNDKYESGEIYDLEAGAGDCQSGIIYKKTVSLDFTGDGNLKYRFFATDGYEVAGGAPAGDSSVTVVDAVKVRNSGGSGWFSTITEAINNSLDPSTILVYPDEGFIAATYPENVSFASKPNRTLQSVCGRDYTTIAKTGTVVSVRSANVVIDGFTISGGTYGLYFEGSSAITGTVKNSYITSNAEGVYINTNSTVTIEDSLIKNNTTRGVRVGSTDRLMIYRSEISDNNPSNNANQGGGLNFGGGSGTHIISACTISNNKSGTTKSGGGLYIGGGAKISISMSTIDNNNSGLYGGGMYINDSTPEVTVTSSFIQGNTGSSGGGINVNTGKVTISDTFIQGNTAGVTNGGGIYNGTGTFTLTNVMLTGNIASSRGGGIYDNGGAIKIYNSTIAGNYAAGTSTSGNGFYASGTNDIVQNSIVWGNMGGTTAQITGTPTVSYSDVQGGSTSNGNINSDPLFVNLQQATSGNPTTAGDFHICYASGSPAGCTSGPSQCIDAGTATGAPDNDIDGDCRSDGDCTSGPETKVDMGADEYVP